MDKHSRNNVDAKKLLHDQLPSPVSVLGHPTFTESGNSDTADSINTDGKSSAFKFSFHFFLPL